MYTRPMNSPIDERRRWGMVTVSLGLALALWRGGFFHPAEYAFALVGVAAACTRPRLHTRDPILWALAAIALANIGAALVAGRSDVWAPALAACALLPFYAVTRDLAADGLRGVLIAIAAMAVATSAAGLVAYLLHSTPDAQRLDDVWRAAGTFEYPPALALVAACGLAAVLALHAAEVLTRGAATALAAVLAAAVVLSFDRAGIVIAVLILTVFLVRFPASRRLWPAAAAGLVLAAIVLIVRTPGLDALQAHLGHGLLTGRSEVWSDGWDAFRRRPLEGFGPGGFARIYLGQVDGGTVGLAHNLVLEQAVEAGVVAAAGALVLVVTALVRCGRGVLSSSPVAVAYACSGLAVSVSGLYDFSWSFAPIALLGVVGAAGVSASADSEN